MRVEHTNIAHIELVCKSLSFEWNSIRLGSLTHGIVIKTTQHSAKG